MTPARTDAHPARGASSLAVVVGLWLFLSPWIYGVSGNSSDWNSWIIGALIVIFAAMRRSHPAVTSLSWINSALGIWTFASPWVYGYVRGDGRFVNSLCIGIIVFCTAIVGANSDWTSHHIA
jgi:hypothetical protein